MKNVAYILIIFIWILNSRTAFAYPSEYGTPTPIPSGSSFASPSATLPTSPSIEWAQKASRILKESGVLNLPDNIDYKGLITYEEFAHLLIKVTNSPDKRRFLPSSKDIDVKAPITRGAAVELLVRVFGFSTQIEKFIISESRFTDVPPSHLFFKAILLAEQTKLISGYPGNIFRPDEVLTFGEAISLLETVLKWKMVFPKGKPEWVKSEEDRNVFWYRMLDGFRLILTLFYGFLAIYCLVIAGHKSRKNKSDMHPIIVTFLVISISLVFIWLNEILYNYGFIERGVYQFFAILSILASVLLIKVGVSLKQTVEPKEKASIDVGYVDYVDAGRGEIFVIDSITKRRILALVTEQTKIYNQEDKLLNLSFLSEIGVGDFVNIRGTTKMKGSVIEAETVLLIAARGQIGTLAPATSLYLEQKS